jgi:hypothetical protein
MWVRVLILLFPGSSSLQNILPPRQSVLASPCSFTPSHEGPTPRRIAPHAPVRSIPIGVILSVAKDLLFALLLSARSSVSAFSSPDLCPFDFKLSTACPERGRRGHFLWLSPFPATLADHPQLTENPATLSPVPATLASRVKHNPFVCHSYKKHPGWGVHPSSQIFFLRSLATRHSLLSTISFTIRTSAKRVCNSRRSAIPKHRT